MAKKTSTAISHPNIALIKYWGNLDHGLRIPANNSLSMTLGGLETRTSVSFDPDLDRDEVELDDHIAEPVAYDRVVGHLDKIRTIADIQVQVSHPRHQGLRPSQSQHVQPRSYPFLRKNFPSSRVKAQVRQPDPSLEGLSSCTAVLRVMTHTPFKLRHRNTGISSILLP